MQEFFRKYLCSSLGCINSISSIESNNSCKNKYLKYKQKYLDLKKYFEKNKYVNL